MSGKKKHSTAPPSYVYVYIYLLKKKCILSAKPERKAERVRESEKKNRKEKFSSLMWKFSVEFLKNFIN